MLWVAAMRAIPRFVDSRIGQNGQPLSTSACGPDRQPACFHNGIDASPDLAFFLTKVGKIARQKRTQRTWLRLYKLFIKEIEPDELSLQLFSIRAGLRESNKLLSFPFLKFVAIDSAHRDDPFRKLA